MIIALWTVSLGGVTLLDAGAGDYMPEEPKISRAQGIQQVRNIRAPFATRRGRANVEHTLSFSRRIIFTTSAAARMFLLTHAAELPTVEATAMITVLHGNIYHLLEAIITSFDCDTEANHAILRYSLTGGELALETIVPDETTGSGGLLDETGAQMTTEGGAPIILNP